MQFKDRLSPEISFSTKNERGHLISRGRFVVYRFFNRINFVACMMSIKKALSYGTAMELIQGFRNFTVRINLKTFCHYFFKDCHDYFKGWQDFLKGCQDFFKDTKKSYCQDFCTSPRKASWNPSVVSHFRYFDKMVN